MDTWFEYRSSWVILEILCLMKIMRNKGFFMSKSQIPFWIAVIININIVIGSAFFLGAPRIAALGGFLAPCAWLLCGLLLFPLVLVLARLAREYPTAGGIYVYSKERLGRVWGFLSGWGYFIGTVAGNAAVIHAFSQQLHASSWMVEKFATWGITDVWVDIAMVCIFTIFNLLNVTFFERLQITFALIKSIPFLLLACAAPMICSFSSIGEMSYNIEGLFSSIPFVLFAYIGVEACCAIADQIQGGHRAGARAILTSFIIIVSIYTVFQALLLCSGDSSLGAFLSILPKLTSNKMIITFGNNLIFSSILVSFLAGFYGMFYYNNWNLYAMAEENSLPCSAFIRTKNKQNIPWVCVIIQSVLVLIGIVGLRTSTALITIGDFGVLLAYALSIFSYLHFKRSFLGLSALGSCGILLYICFNGLWGEGLLVGVPFIATMLLGLMLFFAGNFFNSRMFLNR